MNGLPPWNEIKNEIGKEFNEFNIIRGKQFIEFGKDIWIGYFCLIDGSGGLKIGNNVTVASGVHIYTHDSSMFRAIGLPKDPINGTHIKRNPVTIGNNVQIGANSVILPGINIGNNIIIGALTLVNKDIPDGHIAVGSPVRILRKI